MALTPGTRLGPYEVTAQIGVGHGGKLLAARVSGGDSLRVDAPVELFDGPYTLDLMGHQRDDVAPDGQSFLMVENSDNFPIVVVQNWFEELKRLVPVK